jgi:hypothetical protein
MKINTPSCSALGPERAEFRVRQFRAIDAAADQGTAHGEPLDRVFELLGGEIGMLQRHRGQPDKAVGICRANLGEPFVLQVHDLPGEVGLGLVPEDRVEAERFHVDALPVHRLDPVLGHDQRLQRHLQPHQRHRLRHLAMGAHVDGPDPLAVDDHFPPLGPGRLGHRGTGHLAADKGEAGDRAGGAAE